MPKPRPNQEYGEIVVKGRTSKIMESFGRLDTDDLKDDFERTGAESLWLGIIAARAENQAAMAKVDFEILEAQLDREVREAFAKNGVDTTEPMVKAAVRLDPRWREYQQRMFDAKEASQIADSAKYTLVRKDQKLEKLEYLLTLEVLAARGQALPAASAPAAPRPGGNRAPMRLPGWGETPPVTKK